MTGRRGYLGVDLGSSGLKLTLLLDDGSVVAEAEASYSIQTQQPGYAETDPRDWAAALERALADLALHVRDVTIQAVGVTGQMHGLVLADAQGIPVRPAILWPDQRALRSLDRWRAMPAEALAALGNPLAPGMAGPVLTWLAQNEPSVLERTAALRSPKDWLRSQLTGDAVTERSDASATLLWDVVSDTWSPEALQTAAVDRAWIPAIAASDEVVGTARLPIGANAGTEVPVVAGGADTACALVALRDHAAPDGWAETIVVNLGTGVQAIRPRERAVATPRPLTHQYADTDGGWYEMLAVQNGGLALEWVQGVLGLSWDDFVAAAQASTAGAKGVRFLPFLTSERGGLAAPDSTASWSGLSAAAGRQELARSALEALAFTVRRGVELLGSPPARVLLCGGGARHEWVRQLVTDVLGRPVEHLPQRSASAVGAALLAARGRRETPHAQVESHTVLPARAAALDHEYDAWLAAVSDG